MSCETFQVTHAVLTSRRLTLNFAFALYRHGQLGTFGTITSSMHFTNTRLSSGVHVQGAIRNGASETDIQEALIQVAVYAGAPCALESTRVAWEALERMRASGELK